MAQTEEALSMAAAKVYWSDDGSTWKDISGYANSVEDATQERNTGVGYTFDGDTGIIKVGKRVPLNLKFNLVHAEEAGGLEELRPYFEAGSAVYFLWIPKGSTAGNFKYTTEAGYIDSFPYPAGDAESGDPVAAQVGFITPAVTKGTVS